MSAKKTLVSDPLIEKNVVRKETGIDTVNVDRHTVGVILRGHKNIYKGNSSSEIRPNKMFFLEPGTYYFSDHPGKDGVFEQLVFGYSTEGLKRVLGSLRFEYGVELDTNGCDDCGDPEKIVFDTTKTLSNYFTSFVEPCFGNGLLADEVYNRMKVTEVAYMLLEHGGCCLRRRMLGSTDSIRESFEHLIRRNIFSDKSIEELADESNRSLTSFKQEFKRYYNDSPRRWMTRQRLIHASVLLLSGGMSIAEVGNECGFPNTSHFIKLFRKEFGTTPAVYRRSLSKVSAD